MKITRTIAAALLFIVGLTACESTNVGIKEGIGLLGGAAAGAAAGSQVGDGTGQLVAVAVGTLTGAFLGREIGASLDRADQAYHAQALRQASAAPVGDAISWNNPDSGNAGSVRTVRDGTSSTGAYCREFQQTIVVAGQVQESYGTACRQRDGTWRIAR